MKGAFASLIKGAVMAFVLMLSFTASAQDASQDVKFSKAELTVRTAGGRYYPFTVELAVNDEQRAHGLMFRQQMDSDHGMLFDFGAPRRVSMWMENTVLALDMVFIQTDGTISHIRQNAVPYSRDIIDSHGPVKYVLELNAGRTRALGIRVGDKVIGAPLGNGG
jgi:uncharacterized membrane protein (UPF0127 family)